MSHMYPEGSPVSYEDQTEQPEDPCDRCHEDPCVCDRGERL